jgi:predicted TIM-barrel fold metal-dependent hydrolase
MERLVLVSADGHAGPLPEEYRPYLDRLALEHFDGFVEDHRRYVDSLYGVCHYSEETIATIDDRNAIRSGGTTGAWDVSRRLKEMDDEGIAAELLVYNHQLAGQPFFSPVCSRWSPELRASGVRAFHRWLADYKSAAEDRFIAMAESGPCVDMEQTVNEIRWAAEHGFKLVELPGLCVDPDLPPLYSDYFEPLWRVCAELGLVVALHAGWGQPQGRSVEFWEEIIRETGGFDEFVEEQVAQTGTLTAPTIDTAAPFAITVSVARAMWQLMLGGVFDRHPGLKCALIEVRAGWIPATLKRLDARFERGDTGMAMKPSEYFQENIFMAPSFVHRCEIEMRHEIGVAKMMFARDYPHLEGTWPNTHDWIRAAFAGVPLNEARLILGQNAIDCFDLDRRTLETIAAQIGPTPEQLLGDHHVRNELINHFHARGGYLKPALNFDEAEFTQLLTNDITATNPVQHDQL